MLFAYNFVVREVFLKESRHPSMPRLAASNHSLLERSVMGVVEFYWRYSRCFCYRIPGVLGRNCVFFVSLPPL
jgi:hypothetical protein